VTLVVEVILAVLAVLLVLGLFVVLGLWRRSRLYALALVERAEEEARRIVARAEIENQRIQKDAEITARERLLAARTEFEQETRGHRLELAAIESRTRDEVEENKLRGKDIDERENRIVDL
jgi:ribonuclease Y